MYVSVVVCLCLYAYRFSRHIFSLLLNLVNKESESESAYVRMCMRTCVCASERVAVVSLFLNITFRLFFFSFFSFFSTEILIEKTCVADRTFCSHKLTRRKFSSCPPFYQFCPLSIFLDCLFLSLSRPFQSF